MKRIQTALPGCNIIEPQVWGDARGYFFEVFNAEKSVADGDAPPIQQVNVSRSAKSVLRGLHFQWPQPQGKLVWVMQGEVYDVAVDVRRGSPTFGQWEACVISENNRRQFWIPEGFAHGFQVMSESAIFCYLCTRPYQEKFDRSIHPADAQLQIDWPDLAGAVMSDKDRNAGNLVDLMESLPSYENSGNRG